MPGQEEFTLNLRGRKRKSINRRSSILKSPSRNVLLDLDPNNVEDPSTHKKSRRVSFSDKCQVKEFVTASQPSWLKKMDDTTASQDESQNVIDQQAGSQIAGLDRLLTGQIQDENLPPNQGVHYDGFTEEIAQQEIPKVNSSLFLASLMAGSSETNVTSTFADTYSAPYYKDVHSTAGSSDFGNKTVVYGPDESMDMTVCHNDQSMQQPKQVLSGIENSYFGWDTTSTKVFNESTFGMEFTRPLNNKCEVGLPTRQAFQDRTQIFNDDFTEAGMEFTQCYSEQFTSRAHSDVRSGQVEQLIISSSDSSQPLSVNKPIDTFSFLQSLQGDGNASNMSLFNPTENDTKNDVGTRISSQAFLQSMAGSESTHQKEDTLVSTSCIMQQSNIQTSQASSGSKRSAFNMLGDTSQNIPEEKKIDSRSFLQGLMNTSSGPAQTMNTVIEPTISNTPPKISSKSFLQSLFPQTSDSSLIGERTRTISSGSDQMELTACLDISMPNMPTSIPSTSRLGSSDNIMEKTRIFGSSGSCADMELTCAVTEALNVLHPKVSPRSSSATLNKTQVFDKTSTGDMELTCTVTVPDTDNIQLACARNSLLPSKEFEQSIIASQSQGVIPANIRQLDSTEVFNADKENDMSFTCAFTETQTGDLKREKSSNRTVNFDLEPTVHILSPFNSMLSQRSNPCDESHIGMNHNEEVSNNVASSTDKTVMFEKSEADMEFTSVVSNGCADEIAKAPFVNPSDESHIGMNLNEGVSNNIAFSTNKTVMFEKSEADMEFTSVVSSGSLNEISKAPFVNPSDESHIGMNHDEEVSNNVASLTNKTVMFEKLEADMEFTSVVSSAAEISKAPLVSASIHSDHTQSSQRTILSNKTIIFEKTSTNMELTSVLSPDIVSELGKTSNDSVKPQDSTVVFNTDYDNDMEFTCAVTETIPLLKNDKPEKSANRTVIFDMEPTVHILSPYQSHLSHGSSTNGESYINVNQTMSTVVTDVTSNQPASITNNEKIIPDQTVLFEKTSADMEFTAVVSSESILKSPFVSPSQGMPIQDNKTIVFDQTGAGMDFTTVSTEMENEKIITPILTSSESSESINNSPFVSTSLGIPRQGSIQDNKTIVFDQTGAGMDFTTVSTGIEDEKITPLILTSSESNQEPESGSKTVLFDQTNAGMEFTSAVPSDILPSPDNHDVSKIIAPNDMEITFNTQKTSLSTGLPDQIPAIVYETCSASPETIPNSTSVRKKRRESRLSILQSKLEALDDLSIDIDLNMSAKAQDDKSDDVILGTNSDEHDGFVPATQETIILDKPDSDAANGTFVLEKSSADMELTTVETSFDEEKTEQKKSETVQLTAASGSTTVAKQDTVNEGLSDVKPTLTVPESDLDSVFLSPEPISTTRTRFSSDISSPVINKAAVLGSNTSSPVEIMNKSGPMNSDSSVDSPRYQSYDTSGLLTNIAPPSMVSLDSMNSSKRTLSSTSSVESAPEGMAMVELSKLDSSASSRLNKSGLNKSGLNKSGLNKSSFASTTVSDVIDLIMVQPGEVKSVADYLSMLGIGLEQDLEKHCRRSIGAICSVRPPESVSDYLKLAILEPEVEIYQWACEQMTSMIEKCKAQNAQQEAELIKGLPHMVEYAANEANYQLCFKHALETSTACKIKANKAFKKWRLKIVQTLLEVVEEEEISLQECKEEISSKIDEVKSAVVKAKSVSTRLDELLEKVPKELEDLREARERLASTETDLSQAQTKHKSVLEEKSKLQQIYNSLQVQLNEIKEKAESSQSQDLVDEKTEIIYRMKDMVCWELEASDEQEMMFSFLEKSLMLQIKLGEKLEATTGSFSQRAVKGFNLEYILPADSKPPLELAHSLLKGCLLADQLREQCQDTWALSLVLWKMSKVVIEVEKLMAFLGRWVRVKCFKSIYSGTSVSVRFSNLPARVYFEVTFHLDPSAFLLSKPRVEARTFIGHLRPDDILKLISPVKPGPRFIQESLKIIDENIQLIIDSNKS